MYLLNLSLEINDKVANQKQIYLKRMERIQRKEINKLRHKSVLSNINTATDLGELKHAILGMFTK